MRDLSYDRAAAGHDGHPIHGHHAVGHDVEFISLDMTNSCTIRCFRTPRRTVLVFGQWSDLDANDDAEDAVHAVRRSLEETDAEGSHA